MTRRPLVVAVGLLAEVAAVAASLTPAEALANEPGTYGLGSRSSAMAGAVTADPSDFSASYYNPAALAAARGVELSIGYTFNANHLRINDLDTNVDDVRGVVVGIVAPGELFEIPFAFGIASHIPDDGLSRVTALRQEVPRWELYDHRAAVLFLAANLAVRPAPWLELGGGVAFLAATRGRFGIRGTADIIEPQSSELEHEVDADLTSIRYPQAGVRFIAEGLGAIGVTYRGENKLDLELEAELRGNVDFAGIDVPLLYELESQTIDAFVPQQVAVGVSVWRVERLHVNLDVTFVNWAAYESPTARTSAQLDASPPPGTPVELPDDLSPVDVIPPAFENRFVPRFGLEYVVPLAGEPRRVHDDPTERSLLELPLRLGYAYEASPVPPQTGRTSFVDADRHTLAFGIGLGVFAPLEELPGSLHLDLHGSVSILPEVTTRKDNPADFTGDYVADGTMVGIGTTLRGVF